MIPRRFAPWIVGALLVTLAAWSVAIADRTSRLRDEAERGVTWLRRSERMRTDLATSTTLLIAGEPAQASAIVAAFSDPAFPAAAPTTADEIVRWVPRWRDAAALHATAVASFPTRADPGSAPSFEALVRSVHALDEAVGGLRNSVSRELRTINVALVGGWNSLWLFAVFAFVALAVVGVLLLANGRRNAELRLSRADLETSERRFRAMADDAPVVLWLEDASGRITFVNRRWFEIIGGTWIEQREFYDVVHPEDVAEVRKAYAEGRASRTNVDVEYRIKASDGDWRWFYDRAAPRFDAAGSFLGFHGVAVDVTERRAFERRAAEAQQLEAVGRLAGGVAHDFNNFLTVMLGCADDIARPGVTATELGQVADDLRRAAALAAALTGRLLTFSRLDVSRPDARVDLGRALTEFEPLLRRMLGEDVRLVTRYAPDLGAVSIDPGRLTQIVLNLAANARQAMPQGGVLRIAAEPRADDPLRVRLVFEDEGVGMTAEVRARLFEPFFTTKTSPKNVGLGLATVDTILRQVGATIAVANREGGGARFEISLLRAPDGAAAPTPAEAVAVGPSLAPEVSRRARPLVLLAEDDDAIRKLARRYLMDAGCDVLEATDGEAAWQAARASERKPDALFTDVIMPRLSGGRLAEELRAYIPGIKVVFMSGYADDHVVRHGVSVAESDFLQKPFSRAQFVAKARETLGLGAAPLGTGGSGTRP